MSATPTRPATPVRLPEPFAILTLLPLAFALGQGSEMQQPLAIAIIFGLIVQLPLVLGVMPALFHLTQERSGAKGAPATPVEGTGPPRAPDPPEGAEPAAPRTES